MYFNRPLCIYVSPIYYLFHASMVCIFGLKDRIYATQSHQSHLMMLINKMISGIVFPCSSELKQENSASPGTLFALKKTTTFLILRIIKISFASLQYSCVSISLYGLCSTITQQLQNYRIPKVCMDWWVKWLPWFLTIPYTVSVTNVSQIFWPCWIFSSSVSQFRHVSVPPRYVSITNSS